MTTDEELRTEAIERLKARRGFFIHLGVYLIVNILLFAQWAIVTPGAGYWPLATTLGWGIGVAFHGLAVLVGKKEPEEYRIAREMRRIHGGTSGPAHA